jgi:hypothetical protein
MSRAEDRAIGEEREWLQKYAPAYREAMENLSNPTYVRGLLKGIADKMQLVLTYNANEQPAHAACQAIGATQAMMEKTLTDLEFVDQYEDRRERFEEAIANVESRQEESHGDQLLESDEL